MADMTHGWLDVTIGDLIELQRGIDITKKEQRPGRVPVVSSGGISSFHDTAAASGPGVVIGRKGTLGKVFFLETEYWPHDTTLWVRDFRGNDPKFIYYLLDSMDFKQLDVGSANPTLNRNHVHPIPVVVPPVVEQRAISGVLGALDHKIESNRRLRGILANISQVSLLVEVGEIVQASPGVSGGAEGLPLQGSDLRIVETGLRNDAGEKSFMYLATADVFDNEYRIGELGTREELPSRANMAPGSDRCWFARMKGTPKWLWTPTDYSDEWDSMILSTGFLGVESSESRLAPIVMTAIRTPEFQDAKNQLCNGTTMQSLNNDSAGQLVIRVPTDQSTLTRLSEDLRTNLLLEHQLNRQSMRLIGLRDTLMPELLSGRLRVKDAESMMENV